MAQTKSLLRFVAQSYNYVKNKLRGEVRNLKFQVYSDQSGPESPSQNTRPPTGDSNHSNSVHVSHIQSHVLPPDSLSLEASHPGDSQTTRSVSSPFGMQRVARILETHMHTGTV